MSTRTGVRALVIVTLCYGALEIVGLLLLLLRLVDNGVQYIDSCTLLHSGSSSHINGVALLLDRRLSGSLVSWSPISDRLLCARLVHKHGHLSVIVAYAPTQPSADADKDTFNNNWTPNISNTAT